jgi:phage terminase large subunit-like protein
VPTQLTDGSTPRLSEAARHVKIPTGIVTTAWPRVVAQCEDMGVAFDSWQHGIGSVALGKRRNGKYAATVGGVVLSIPRQVGKTFLVGMIVIALAIIYPGMTILWTAHRTRTATKTFRTFQGMVKRKKIWPHVLGIRTANGEQEIAFRNGSLIMFGAREQGFGRGFEEVDIEVFDEGQILTEKALEDMVAATNQSRQEAGALLFFMGTPPRPSDPGEEFSNRRSKALSGKAPNMFYVEFSADPDADCDDREQWAKANVSFPSRTPVESMERLRENLTDDDSFRREALGIWDSVETKSVIPRSTWDELADAKSLPVDTFALAVGVSPDRSRAAVGWCGRREDGSWHIEVDAHDPGTAWVAEHVAKRCAKNRFRAVVINGSSPAASVVEELRALKVKVTVMTAPDVAQSFGMFYDAVMRGTVRHRGDQPQLSAALAVAGKRDLTGGSAWSQKHSSSDITTLEAVTFALWGAQSSKAKHPGRGGDSGRDGNGDRSNGNRSGTVS